MIKSWLVVCFQRSGDSSVQEWVVVLTNGGFGGSLKASAVRCSSGNQWLCEDCTWTTAPLMDLHPFPPLSASETLSHYFQQLLSSRHPERHDRKSVFVLFIYFFPIDCHFLMVSRPAAWSIFTGGGKLLVHQRAWKMLRSLGTAAAVICVKVAHSAPARWERKSGVASRTRWGWWIAAFCSPLMKK